MHRRQFLAGAVTVTAAIAGCSGDNNTETEGGDDNNGGTTWQITGELRNSASFEIVDLGGNANDDNTLTLGGELRYTGEESVTVSGLFYNFYDADGGSLISANVGLDGEQTVATDDTFSFEQTTEDLGKIEASNVAHFEAIVNSS